MLSPSPTRSHPWPSSDRPTVLQPCLARARRFPPHDRPRHRRTRLTVLTASATLQRTWDPCPAPSTPASPVTRRPSRKLDHCRLGPFEVIADPRLRTPYAVRLRLPETMHVSLLEHATDDPFPCPTWEDAAGEDGLQAVDRFHALHPQKPGPLGTAPPPRLGLDPLGFAEAQRLEGGTVTALAVALTLTEWTWLRARTWHWPFVRVHTRQPVGLDSRLFHSHWWAHPQVTSITKHTTRDIKGCVPGSCQGGMRLPSIGSQHTTGSRETRRRTRWPRPLRRATTPTMQWQKSSGGKPAYPTQQGWRPRTGRGQWQHGSRSTMATHGESTAPPEEGSSGANSFGGCRSPSRGDTTSCCQATRP